jgi:hypothetical protein
MFLSNIGCLSTDYTALCPRRQKSSPQEFAAGITRARGLNRHNKPNWGFDSSLFTDLKHYTVIFPQYIIPYSPAFPFSLQVPLTNGDLYPATSICLAARTSA